ncbi:hypothetical protein FA15DRAFT_759626 [Coprinopsis marcescibilis]|uniref:Uncharacterized protein n=1 Tax=Coprinopsis marcescibilis TaxID=230819 RepID=A0A5C3KIX0_COPMA|nr:hypothetical protein FA15DRAFT_759626 [Coprinopsis marcescibilis]
MVRSASQLFIAVLAVTPALSAPLLQRFDDANEQFSRDAPEFEFEARYSGDADFLEMRAPISAGAWELGKAAFQAAGTATGMGVAFAPLIAGWFKKKKAPAKREFLDYDLEERDFDDEFEMRGFEDDEHLYYVRDVDGSIALVRRAPYINPAALLKIGSKLGSVASFIGRHNKWLVPAVASGAFAAGTAARAKSLRGFDEDLDARDFLDFADEMFERELNELD